jgi:hypothetical protein
MTRNPNPLHRIRRCLTWTSALLVLSAGAVIAAQPTPPEPNQPVTRGAPAQIDAPAHRQPVQTVSDALGQRLDRMMLETKPVSTR